MDGGGGKGLILVKTQEKIMLDINPIPIPICRFKDCKKIAEYEFTDVILADKDKKMEDRHLETVTISYSCENHVEEIRLKYAE